MSDQPRGFVLLDLSTMSTAASDPVDEQPHQVFGIPESQRYYWTPEWQAGERESLLEFERGESVQFSSGREAAAWLLSDEDDDPATPQP